jgi:hypothetical protein
MTPVEIADAVVKSIYARKHKLEHAPGLDDATWQYASGMLSGANEVKRALENAAAAPPPSPLPCGTCGGTKRVVHLLANGRRPEITRWLPCPTCRRSP